MQQQNVPAASLCRHVTHCRPDLPSRRKPAAVQNLLLKHKRSYIIPEVKGKAEWKLSLCVCVCVCGQKSNVQLHLGGLSPGRPHRDW